ncbi:hypothetical protein SETIT_2G184200v2 [Setaria italica]|uniref:Uncharacterized protein n=1 Tax=Setaria italica TaxID=4555 RepID=A0A368Q058_SETIT|nr:uncharacterized protein LOC101777097 [Setaria italica]RCV11421.1 hypothetical protein SETIT_2G184200v2 [Setaria italica]
MVQLWGCSFHVPTVRVLVVCVYTLLVVSCVLYLLPCSFCSEAAMMGFFRDTGVVSVGGRGGSRTGGLFQYQRLECLDEEVAPRSRWRWLPAALNGKVASPCLFHVKKVKWGRITSALIPRKVAELSAKIRHARGSGMTEAEVCPTVIFMSPWGLPVLSRPLLAGGHRGRYHHGRDAF